MISSLRRITSALLGVAVLALTIATAYQVATLCSLGQPSCLVAAVTFGVVDSPLPTDVSFDSPESSPAVAMDEPSVPGILFDVVQVLSIYLILVSVLVIVVLEFFELRYLKQLTRPKHV